MQPSPWGTRPQRGVRFGIKKTSGQRFFNFIFLMMNSVRYGRQYQWWASIIRVELLASKLTSKISRANSADQEERKKNWIKRKDVRTKALPLLWEGTLRSLAGAGTSQRWQPGIHLQPLHREMVKASRPLIWVLVINDNIYELIIFWEEMSVERSTSKMSIHWYYKKAWRSCWGIRWRQR
jgi:hypothetical protein